MNKKPLDVLLQQQNFNDTLFKQSISIVQSTKNIIPLSKIPIEMMNQKQTIEIKRKQQTMETQLAKTIKLFGQILGVSKNSYGTITDYGTQIFDELTDLIETSCQSYVDKKKNIKYFEKQKQKTQQSVISANRGFSSRPQDKYPQIKPALFSPHFQQQASAQYQPILCEKIQHSQSISQPFVYVSTKEGLQKMIMELQSCKQIAVDLEHSPKSYEGFTCLIQISSRYKDFILDVFPLWQHMHLLKALIENQKIVKVMHGAEMDSKWLQRDFDIHIKNLFDTYKASRVLGYPKFSYAYLLHHYCDTTTDKTYQLADWRQRPLSPQMLNYARIDTHYLLQIWDKIIFDLNKQSVSMNLDPQTTIRQIYRSSHDVSLSKIQLFNYKKKQIYQNIKNDTKADDFQIIETVFWVIDKIAKQQNESFDQLVNKRILTDILGRVKDLIQNKRATIDMLRVKIDRLIGSLKSHKHDKVALLLNPLKKQLEKYFLQAKKQVEASAKKKVKAMNSNETPLIQKIGVVQRKLQGKQNICSSSQLFRFQKPSEVIQQLDYPLKTYQNFSLQQRFNNKKNAFSMIVFEPIMNFMSKKFNIEQKNECAEQQESKKNDQQSEQMEIQDQDHKAQQQGQQDEQEGFLEFKRIKPNVIYTIQEQEVNEAQNNAISQKPKKKRKELQYEQRIKNKQGNIYELLQDE